MISNAQIFQRPDLVAVFINFNVYLKEYFFSKKKKKGVSNGDIVCTNLYVRRNVFCVFFTTIVPSDDDAGVNNNN